MKYCLTLALLFFFIESQSQAPSISSLNPTSGSVGATVTITGTGFDVTPSNNIVYFGSVKASVTAATATTLTVTVPVGAGFQLLSVTVNNLTGFSAFPFDITYPGGGINLNSSSFATAKTLSGGAFVAQGDLDGDGKIDLATTQFTSNIFTIHRNTTVGSVVSFALTDLGGVINPISAKMGDINGDGKLDVVVLSNWSSAAYVFKNNSTPGTISLTGAGAFSTGSGPRKLALADIDQDGKLDIIVTNQSANTISVLRNTSSGATISFAATVDFVVPATPEGVNTADLNNDGKPDIMVACSDNNLSAVFRNTSVPGTISLATRQDFGTGSFPWDVIGADIDGDGKAEMISTNLGPNTISVFKNTSTATISFDAKADFGTTSSPKGIDVADFDADGKIDVATANSFSGSEVCILRNISTAGTVAFNPFVSFPVAGGAFCVTTADFDLDGLTDVMSGNSFSNFTNITLLRNLLPIGTTVPQCTQLLAPANAAVLSSSVAQVFKWRKDPNATGYRLRIIPNIGVTTDVNLTDSFYSFTPTPGTSYSWNVTPLNLPDANAICPGFNFSTCPIAGATAITISATGNTSKCIPDSTRLKASSGVNIQWFLDDVLIPGATADTFWAKTPGVYTIKEGSGSCFSLASNSITISNLPVPAKPQVVAGGPTTFCAGGSVTLSSSLTYPGYQWFNDGVAIPSGTGKSQITTVSGGHYVQITDNSGCSNNSDTVSVIVLALPSTPVVTIVAGSNPFCAGDSLKLSSSANSGNQWYKNATLIAGATAKTYTVKDAGTYTVRETVNTCSSAFSTDLVVTVTALPTTPAITITSGTTTFCAGDSVKFTSSAASGNKWYKNNTLIVGATGTTYTAKEAGTYTVTTTQGSCTSAASAGTTVTINPLPAKPTINSTITSLSTAAGLTSYKWFLNNVAITGGTTNQITVNQSGIYKVEITDNNGCKNVSDDLNFIYTGLNDIVIEGNKLSFFPNPVVDNLQVNVQRNNLTNGLLQLTITDVNGKVLKTSRLQNGINTLSLAGLSAGTYHILVQNGKSQKAVKIVKIK